MPTFEQKVAKEQRIEHIMQLMREARFERGETVNQLATQWGLAKGLVGAMASEAHRRVFAEFRDTEEGSVFVAAALRRVARESLMDAENDGGLEGSPSKHRKNVIEAAKTYAMLAGLNAATKIDVTVQASQLTDADLDQEIVRVLTALPSERRQAILGAVMRADSIDVAPVSMLTTGPDGEDDGCGTP